MTAIRDEKAENLAYELRRRIAPILGNAELALEGVFGPVTPEQREALEEIVGSSEELGTVIARAFEAGDPEDIVGTDDTPLPATAPEDAPPIAVIVDDEFDAILVDQLERSGHEVLAGDPAGTPHHAVVDCGVPTRADLEAIRERAGRAETVSLTVVSTIDAGSLPCLGVSAIVSPTVPAELLAEELSALVGDDVAGVALLGRVDERFRETLAEVEGASVIEVDPSADDLLETIGASDADVAVLDADGGDLDDELLAALRNPSNPNHLPLVAVGPPPTGGEWTAIPGHDQFAHRPLSTVELAGEVLIELSRSGVVGDE